MAIAPLHQRHSITSAAARAPSGRFKRYPPFPTLQTANSWRVNAAESAGWLTQFTVLAAAVDGGTAAVAPPRSVKGKRYPYGSKRGLTTRRPQGALA